MPGVVWYSEYYSLVFRSGTTSFRHNAIDLSIEKEYRQKVTAHGLRTPNEAYFYRNPKLLGLGRKFGQTNFGVFEVFSAKLLAPILVQSVPCPCFPLFNHYFYKKLSLYIHIPNIYLGLGFEFGLQRIMDLAIVCP